jgi:hypothetical protein
LHQQCPLLTDDLCSVYETRPVSCRFWASTNVAACLRVFRQSSGETVPTPMSHLKGRGAYEIALSLALKHVGLPHYYSSAALAASASDAEVRGSAERCVLRRQARSSRRCRHTVSPALQTFARRKSRYHTSWARLLVELTSQAPAR